MGKCAYKEQMQQREDALQRWELQHSVAFPKNNNENQVVGDTCISCEAVLQHTKLPLFQKLLFLPLGQFEFLQLRSHVSIPLLPPPCLLTQGGTFKNKLKQIKYLGSWILLYPFLKRKKIPHTVVSHKAHLITGGTQIKEKKNQRSPWLPNGQDSVLFTARGPDSIPGSTTKIL